MSRAIVVLAAAGLTLAACAKTSSGVATGGGGLCKPFNAPAAGAADPSYPVDDCLHRWGYTLAKGPDPADAVARAVLAACSAPLARWNQQSLGVAGAGGPGADAPSLLTGEPTNPIGAHADFAEGRALFYVVQARAGKCDVPRVEDRDKAAPVAAPSTNSPDR